MRDCAIALPAEGPLKKPTNRALLKIVHRPDWSDLVQRSIAGPI